MFMQIDNLYKQFQEAEIEFQIILCDKKQPGSSLRAAYWFRLFRIAHESNLRWAELDRRCSGFTSVLGDFGSDLHKRAPSTLSSTKRWKQRCSFEATSLVVLKRAVSNSVKFRVVTIDPRNLISGFSEALEHFDSRLCNKHCESNQITTSIGPSGALPSGFTFCFSISPSSLKKECSVMA